MFNNVNELKKAINNENIAVIGVGISNVPLIDFLLKNGAKVTAYDKKTPDKLGKIYEDLLSRGVRFSLGDNYLSEINEKLIFKTPGMRYDVPELLKASKNGAIVTSEMEVFMNICPAKIIAVTGSDGKTTTTTLIHKLMTEEGYKTRLGGNIGRPLIDEIDKIGEDEWVILELSSFQLHKITKSPDIAVITNITPNHLDWHTDYKEYIDSKKNIYSYQTSDGILVTNAANEETKKAILEAKGKVRTFSAYVDADFSLEDGKIVSNGEILLDTNEIRVPGLHNVENFMTAIAATYGLVSKDTILKVAKSFTGVQHRIEFVREIDGVKYYNSSIDSSPNRTINTLKVFGDNVVMIAGGKDKGIPYDEIGPAIKEHVKTLVLIGMTSKKIEEAVKMVDTENKVSILYAETYEDAVLKAKYSADSGDIVILSPASTSFDMFNNFEERGNLFKSIVSKL